MLIYLSGAITGTTEEEWASNYQKGRDIAIEFCKHKIPYFSPHLNGWKFDKETGLEHVTWRDYMDMDLEIISRCSGLYMMEGWESSKGAVEEREYAISLGLPIFYKIGDILAYALWGVEPYTTLEGANREVFKLRGMLQRIRYCFAWSGI